MAADVTVGFVQISIPVELELSESTAIPTHLFIFQPMNFSIANAAQVDIVFEVDSNLSGVTISEVDVREVTSGVSLSPLTEGPGANQWTLTITNSNPLNEPANVKYKLTVLDSNASPFTSEDPEIILQPT